MNLPHWSGKLPGNMRYHTHEHVQPKTTMESFSGHGTEDLSKLVRHCCPGKRPTRKAEMLEVLLRLLQEENLPTALIGLTELQKEAVAETAWSDDGYFSRLQFEAKHGRSPWAREENATGAATYYRSNERTLGWLDLLIPQQVMSQEVQRGLRAIIPRPKSAQIGTIDQIPAHIVQTVWEWNAKTNTRTKGTQEIPLVQRKMEHSALRELRSVLRLVDAGKVSVSDKNHWPTSAAMKQIAKVLEGEDFYPSNVADAGPKEEPKYPGTGEPGPIRAFAWPMILQAGKLAKADGSKLALTKAGRAALTAPAHETMRGLVEEWIDTDILDELRRINVIRGQTGNGLRHLSEASDRRVAITEALAECPVGQWISLNEFSRYMQAEKHLFEITSDPWSLYIAEQQYGSFGFNGCGGWNILQFRYILCLSMEYLATLGLIDIAYIPPSGARRDYGEQWGTDEMEYFSRYDGLFHLRLTGLGAYCLGSSESYSPPAMPVRRVLSITPDLQIHATETLTPSDRLLIEVLAIEQSNGDWLLDQAKIRSAIGQGREIGELTGFLESSSQSPLPEAVTALFTDAHFFANVLSDIGLARLIRCSDTTLLSFIASSPAVRKLCCRAGDDMLAVKVKDQTAFRRAVEKLGFHVPSPGRE